MKKLMFKSLNKAISTPIAIIVVIIVGFLAIGGVLAYQYYWQAPEEEILEETPIDETACIDSDGGPIFYTKGTISSKKETYTDECIDNDNLKEYFCAFDKIESEEFRCPNGCKDGYCFSEPSITILSPNGGEKWQYGKNYIIEWKSEGVDKVNIGLEDWTGIIAGDDYEFCTIAEDVSASTGKYSWTIKDCPISMGDSFIVRIVDIRGIDQGYYQQAEDSSNGYFSIEKNNNILDIRFVIQTLAKTARQKRAVFILTQMLRSRPG